MLLKLVRGPTLATDQFFITVLFTIHIHTLPVGHALPMTTMNSIALHEYQLTNKHCTLLVNNILSGHPSSLTSKMTQHSSKLNNAAVCNYHYDIE